jgi:hypothetical protein
MYAISPAETRNVLGVLRCERPSVLWSGRGTRSV